MRYYGKGGRKLGGEMNRLEKKYADHLELQRQAGEILWWSFEAIKFKLADKSWYNPDFLVLMQNHTLISDEVKGYWLDNARTKIKVAADKFPIRFRAVMWEKGAWVYEEF